MNRLVLLELMVPLCRKSIKFLRFMYLQMLYTLTWKSLSFLPTNRQIQWQRAKHAIEPSGEYENQTKTADRLCWWWWCWLFKRKYKLCRFSFSKSFTSSNQLRKPQRTSLERVSENEESKTHRTEHFCRWISFIFIFHIRRSLRFYIENIFTSGARQNVSVNYAALYELTM